MSEMTVSNKYYELQRRWDSTKNLSMKEQLEMDTCKQLILEGFGNAKYV